jgi:hypothetical protein
MRSTSRIRRRARAWALASGVARTAVLAAVATSTQTVAFAQQTLWYVDSDIAMETFGLSDVGPDVDGDGVPELLVTNPIEDCLGIADGVVHLYSAKKGELQKWCGDGGWGADARWVDDIDGLGVPDFVVTQPGWYEPTKYGRGTGRIQLMSFELGTVIREWTGTQTDGYFGQVDVLDDLDGDGFRDLLVTAFEYGGSSEGQVWVLSTGSGAQLRTHVGSVAFGHLGMWFSALPDIDGDGLGDYATSWTLPFSSGQRARVYSGADGSTVATFEGVHPERLGRSFGSCDDVDGDGIAEVLIGGWNAQVQAPSFVEAYSAVTKNFLWRLDGTNNGENFGWRIVQVSDVNHDGYDDHLISAINDPQRGSVAGRVDLVSGRNRRSLFRFYPPIRGVANFGTVTTPGADFDSDGFDDLVIGTTNGGKFESKGGHVAIYAGNDLWLQAESPNPVVGSTVVVDLRGGEPGLLGLLALIDVDGTPTFDVFFCTQFDANGELQLTADIDPSVSGMEFTLMAWAQNRNGRGKLMDATPFVVTVQ